MYIICTKKEDMASISRAAGLLVEWVEHIAGSARALGGTCSTNSSGSSKVQHSTVQIK